MFGAASAWAAVTVKEWLVKTKTKGTVRFYGTPAEEGGSGKVYMVRAGLFEDVDAVLHWHPSSSNAANAESSNSNKSAKFRFSGISAHAAGSPDKGRSALDGVEAMNMMVNMMREHILKSHASITLSLRAAWPRTLFQMLQKSITTLEIQEDKKFKKYLNGW